ncbi:MAG TPA: HEPN domain-containing protein [Pirellulales bacterium]
MALPHGAESRRFYSAAKERLHDAQALLTTNRTTGAVYLAGYAVECMLKAVLLNSAAPAVRSGLMKSFRGKKGHDIEWLGAKYRQRIGTQIPHEVVRHLARLAIWSTSLRYDSRTTDPGEASEFVKSARAIWEWANKRI